MCFVFSEPISYGRTKDRYITQEAGHLSFPKSAIVTLLAKHAAVHVSGREMWLGEVCNYLQWSNWTFCVFYSVRYVLYCTLYNLYMYMCTWEGGGEGGERVGGREGGKGRRCVHVCIYIMYIHVHVHVQYVCTIHKWTWFVHWMCMDVQWVCMGLPFGHVLVLYVCTHVL